MLLPEIKSIDDVRRIIQEVGFLPYFHNNVEGFSIEESCTPELARKPVDGPWDWKADLILERNCVYGKFFDNKAGFISLEWFPDFANMRRDGYDFDSRCDEGMVYYKDKQMYETIISHGEILSTDLKAACNYGKDGNKGFDTILNRLQMGGYICISEFAKKRNKKGEFYGWAVGKYTTPELLFGYDFVTEAYSHPADESRKRIMEHLAKKLGDVNVAQLEKLI